VSSPTVPVRPGGGLEAVGEAVDRVAAGVAGEELEVGEDALRETHEEVDGVAADQGVVFLGRVLHPREARVFPRRVGHGDPPDLPSRARDAESGLRLVGRLPLP